MVMLTYDLPDEIKQVATEGDFDEFSLNEFLKPMKKTEITNLYIKAMFKNG